MSISKRMYGVEGFQQSSTELTLADIKKLIPTKIKEYKLIDQYKRKDIYHLIYEYKTDHKFFKLDLEQLLAMNKEEAREYIIQEICV